MKFLKFKCFGIVFVIFIFVNCLSGCTQPHYMLLHDKVKDKYETRAFLAGDNTGIIVNSDKSIINTKECDFNFTDLLAQQVYNRILSSGSKIDKLIPVASTYYIIDEWKKTGKLERNGEFSNYSIIYLVIEDGKYYLEYEVFNTGIFKKGGFKGGGIKNDGTINAIKKKTFINFKPGIYNDSSVCYADFQKIVQPVIEEFYQELMYYIPDSKL